MEDAAVNLLLNSATVRFDPAVTSPERLVESGPRHRLRRRAPAAAPRPGRKKSASGTPRPTEEFRELRLQGRREPGARRWSAMVLTMPLMAAATAAGTPTPAIRSCGWPRGRSTRCCGAAALTLRRSGRYAGLVLLAITLFVVLWAGRHFYVRAWQAFRHHAADMNTLIAVGTGAACSFRSSRPSLPGFFQRGAWRRIVYYEAVIIIIALILHRQRAGGPGQAADLRRAPGADRRCSPPSRGWCGTARRSMCRWTQVRRRATWCWSGPASAFPVDGDSRRGNQRGRRVDAHRRIAAGREACRGAGSSAAR